MILFRIVVTWFLPLLLLRVGKAEGRIREYYVAIKEVEWDYAPTGENLMKGIPLDQDEDASVFTSRGATTIGRRYKKVVYRRYTDATYTHESHRSEDLGILGPPLKAEVGDQMIVHVWNDATRPYSMHPHGVFYNKSHEGALYRDRTTDREKLDDKISPKDTHVYVWDVNPSFGPTSDDPLCLSWAYHSHVDAPKDTNAGLVGPIVVCRKGVLDGNGKRSDVDRELYIFVTVFDENESWYLRENIDQYCHIPDDVDTSAEDFQESNKMHGINGRMFGNLGGLEVCLGEQIAVYALGLGTEVDMHALHFHGQTIITHGHRQDTIDIFPAVFTTATLTADNPGIFQLSCSVNDHVTAGMLTNFNVSKCGEEQEILSEMTGIRRTYYIGIDEEMWNYGPSGYDITTMKSLVDPDSNSATFFARGENRIGGTYKKAIYHEYKSDRFERRLPQYLSWGLLGPLIKAEVGDTVEVVLRNGARRQQLMNRERSTTDGGLLHTYNIEPHGVFYHDTSPVGPGEVHTYEWSVPKSVAPTSKDSHCIVYIYTSSVDPVKDTNSGLVGPILICKRGHLNEYLNGINMNSLYILLTVFDENSSHYLEENMSELAPGSDLDDDFTESNLMHSMNGLMYGNLEWTTSTNVESDIHIMAIGTEVDMHSFTIEGLPFKFRNEYTNVLSAFPHTTATARIIPTHPMRALAYCHVADHLVGGMVAQFSAYNSFHIESVEYVEPIATRTYYIGVSEEIWDYSPTGQDVMDHDLSAFTQRERGRFIGSQYWKAVYHEYTDSTFNARKPKPAHFGLLGPLISAEEGDIIKVVFSNFTNILVDLHPEGLKVTKIRGTYWIGSEIPSTMTYIWEIPKAMIPGPDQPPCNVGVYGSRVDLEKDPYSGLVGPLRICRKGGLTQSGLTRGFDAEFFLLFLVFDESKSRYLDRNLEEFADVDPDAFDKDNEEFLESNLMHAINGRIGNLEGLEMKEGDSVAWHLIGLGNEVDFHSVHFHGHAFNYTSDYTTHSDVFNLFPGKVGTVAMKTDGVGDWLVHCHVNDHVAAGMNAVYTVRPK